MNLLASILLIVSLACLWRVLVGGAQVRLSGKILLKYLRNHPPKPWRGFEITILDVRVDGEVHIDVQVSGRFIQTSVEVSGSPHYDASVDEVVFRVSQVRFSSNSTNPAANALSLILNQLGSYVAKNVTDSITIKKSGTETRDTAFLAATVKDVRVDGNFMVVSFQRYFFVIVTLVLALCVLLSATWLFAI